MGHVPHVIPSTLSATVDFAAKAGIATRTADHETSPPPARSTAPLLAGFCGVRPILERQTVRATAASNRVTGLHVVGKCDDLIALGATDPVGKRRGPATGGLLNSQGVPRAVRTLHQVARPCSLGQLHEGTTVGAADYVHHRIPKSHCNRPRSKPTTTSSSTVMTGTASRPVRAINSSRAAVSSATFLAVKSSPWDERNSFAA